MCGIAGFSLSPDSTVKVRQLANSLLTAIEDRGYMASGYAYQVDSHMGYYKSATPGSQLKLKGLPTDARHVILHTRLATHGAVTDNRNNHPVISPSENIALVHNGVIYNHSEVRLKIDGDLPDVDTSVIPAVIEQLGVDSLDVLDGDAAIAWFDRKQHNTLHLARYQHSPLMMCQIEDGSFIFASTEQLLWKVLVQLDLMPTWMEKANELEYFTIRDGVILSKQELPAPKYTDSRYDYAYYRHQTSGAKGGYGYYDSYGWREGYGWDWEDDLYEPTYYDTSTASCSIKPNQYEQDILDADWEEVTYIDEYAPVNRPSDAYFYAKVRNDDSPSTDLIYFTEEQSNLWKNELYAMVQEPGLQLVDYGVITTKGKLVSMVDDVF